MVLSIMQILDYAGMFLVRKTHPTIFVSGCRMFLVGSRQVGCIPCTANNVGYGNGVIY
ncbi:hypothetical protein [Candidatus Scalindua japonica]|uniref:hypothetical protein n=1 Tax=Candidatus Scalindua japonica TaxID=1284222 RepID=UPI0013A5A814|nr:hypothetical protein [Candidatus Scalindua japonica]